VDADLALVVAVGVGGVLELEQLLLGQVAGQIEQPFDIVAVVHAEHHQLAMDVLPAGESRHCPSRANIAPDGLGGPYPLRDSYRCR
jgi:hypothetical protein